MFEKNYYSVSYQYVSKHVDIRATHSTEQFRAPEWNDEQMLRKAEQIGRTPL